MHLRSCAVKRGPFCERFAACVKTPASVSRPAPRLGEHGREVLEAIGYDQTAIDALVSAGTVLD